LRIRQWVFQGFRTGIKTTQYPRADEHAAGISPGRPAAASEVSEEQGRRLVEICPTGAIEHENGVARVDFSRCVHCFRCARQIDAPLQWEDSYEWARFAAGAHPPAWPKVFSKSLHIRVVDAGDCGACLSEVKQLNNPHYNMHRLGFFLTPTPRNADILLVVGPVTDQMRKPLQEAYDAMPTPKIVMAVGACALSGGVFGPSIFSGAGVGSLLPVDIEVPGAPPPPLAILHGLLVAAGRKAPARDSASSSRLAEEEVS
jgi:Ni,Fe-hydrogenase III small subunit/ferredoxin-like protein FixX